MAETVDFPVDLKISSAWAAFVWVLGKHCMQTEPRLLCNAMRSAWLHLCCMSRMSGMSELSGMSGMHHVMLCMLYASRCIQMHPDASVWHQGTLQVHLGLSFRHPWPSWWRHHRMTYIILQKHFTGWPSIKTSKTSMVLRCEGHLIWLSELANPSLPPPPPWRHRKRHVPRTSRTDGRQPGGNTQKVKWRNTKNPTKQYLEVKF